MALEVWFGLVVANTALLLTPGPAMLLIVGTSLERGARAGAVTVLGVTVGAQLAMLGSLIGIGALLAASTVAFTLLKVVGACYLLSLGVRAWRAPATALAPASFGVHRARELWLRGFVTSLVNPKAVVFYVAFLPQFVDAARPLPPQLAIMALTFAVQGLVVDGCYALLAGSARRLLQTSRAARIVNRAAGACLIAAGLATLTLRRAA